MKICDLCKSSHKVSDNIEFYHAVGGWNRYDICNRCRDKFEQFFKN